MNYEAVSRQSPFVARATGLLIAVLAGAVMALAAMPGSFSDYVNDYGVQTVYPLMLLPSIVIMAAAGITALLRPMAAQVAAVVGGISGVQVLGIASVASRDWLNFAGAGGASFQRGGVGSHLALIMVFIALVIILVSFVLYLNSLRPREAQARRRGSFIAGLAITVALPILLCKVLHHPGLTAAGQFALWWSMPWGIGIVAAGSAQTPAARRAALLSVIISATITLACAAESPLLGFGLRLPD